MLDQIALMIISANNLFMARDQGRVLTESEFLYMQSCMDFLTDVNRAKALELRMHIERFENGNPEHKPENRTDTGNANENETKRGESEETDQD